MSRFNKPLILTRSQLPRFPQGKDHLPMPANIDGRCMNWVGIGWVDHGPSNGKEKLIVVGDIDPRALPDKEADAALRAIPGYKGW